MSGNNIDLDTGSSPGMDGADIDVNTLYYDTTTAKSPIVQCSQGSDWCKVAVPENQSTFYVEKGAEWDKDRPRATAEQVVNASAVELAERLTEMQNQTATRSRHVQVNATTDTVTVNDTLRLEASQLGTCSSDAAGTMQRNRSDDELYYCDGDHWERLSP